LHRTEIRVHGDAILDNRRTSAVTAKNESLNSSNPRSGAFYKLLWIIFIGCCSGWLLKDFAIFPLQNAWAVEFLMLIVTAVLSVATLMRTLPAENSVMVALYVTVISTVLTMIRVKTGFLSGQVSFNENVGYKIFGLVPWFFPFLWLTLLVNSRGVAKLILRPWRKANYYGFWMIGLTSFFVLLLALQLEPFTTVLNHHWQFASHGPSWHGIPWANFLGWFLSSVFILILTALWFINKQPVKQEPVDFLPLLVWLILLGCLTLINTHHHLLGAGVLGIITAMLVTPAAVKGGRSQY
jgi:uncharacterized membrane protein